MTDQLDYFKVGTTDNVYVSSSSMSYLEPSQGGNILSFYNFFRDNKEEDESKTLTRGKLVHKYIEAPAKFIISDVVKPTDMMSKLIDNIAVAKLNLSSPLGLGRDVDTTIASKNKTAAKKLEEETLTSDYFAKLAEVVGVNKEDTIRAFRFARATSNAYTSYTELTILKDITETDLPKAYLKFALKRDNRIVLSKAEGEAVVGAINGLQLHPRVSALLGLGNNDLDAVLGEVHKELAIYWQESVTPLGNKHAPIKVNCKAMLDRLIVNHQTKAIIYVDLKTTGDSIYKFQNSFENYRYYRQMAFYDRAITKWFNATFPDKDVREYKRTIYLTPVETFGNYLTAPYQVGPLWIFKGTEEAREVLKRFAWHKATGEDRYSFEERQNNHILTFANPC